MADQGSSRAARRPSPASHSFALASTAPTGQRQASSAAARWRWVVLLALTAGTRLWTFRAMVRPGEGEPDSALFVLGAWQWFHHGVDAARIYDRWFSSGYYAICAALLHLAHARLSQVTGILDWLSFAAALATAILVWELGRRLISPAAAFWAAILFLLSPGIWQLGAEPHPEGLGIALLLGALAALLRAGGGGRRAAIWPVLATLALAAALLVRGDGILLFPAFLVFWFLPVHALTTAQRWRATAATIASWAVAIVIFLTVRAALLGQTVSRTQQHAWSKVAGYLGHLSVVHQLLPDVTALGPAVWIFTAAGVALFCLNTAARPRRGWLCFALAWAAPGDIFWFLVRGNNVRHVALYSLPWLWLACMGWSHAASRRPAASPGGSRRWRILRPSPLLAAMAVLALAVDAVAIPANSNLTLYPSGNVPASFALLRQRELQMRGLAGWLLAEARQDPPRRVCYLGATTSPYILLYSLEAVSRQGLRWHLRQTGPVTTLALPGSAPLVFHDVYSPAQFAAARAACPQSFSWEFNAAGGHLWFFGQEWRNLPFHSHWYAARAPSYLVPHTPYPNR